MSIKNNKNQNSNASLKKVVKAQIRMFNKSKIIDNGFKPRQKDLNKLVLEINHYVESLNVPCDEKDNLLEILATHFIHEVLEELINVHD